MPAEFIPVILSNENLRYKGSELPLLGHAGFILVDPDGDATYYEYGLGYVGTDVVASNSNTSIGGVRAVNLGVLKFDDSGVVTETSLQTALDKVFDNRSLYATDPGTVYAAPFSITPSQYDEMSNSVNDFINSIIDGSASNYEIFSNNCLSFVYNTANAANLTVSPYQNSPGLPDDPNIAWINILADDSIAYNYSPASSNDSSSIEPVSYGMINSVFNSSQIESAFKALGWGFKGIGLAIKGSELLLNQNSQYIDYTLDTADPPENQLQVIYSDGFGDQIFETLGSTQTLLGVIINDGTTATSSQITQGSDGTDTFTAAASLQTFIDLGGTDADFVAGTYSSLTEIVDVATITGNTVNTDQQNTFSFADGNNVLIGDSGNNTFVMAPSLTSGTNIIYGGGGTSTYEVYGEVSIVYTHDTNPTPQEIENLSLASGTDGKPLTYIVDPGPNDVIETPDGNVYSGEYEPTIEPTHLVDTPAYAQISETPVTDDVAYNPLGSTATQVGNLEIWNVGPDNGNVAMEAWADDNYPYNKITLSNFVNGDLGINFSGDLVLDSVANGGADGSAEGNLYELAIPGDPGNVFNYTSKTYVGSASSGGDDNNTSSGGSSSSGNTNNATLSTYPVISGGVTDNLSAGNSFVGATIANGGMLIVGAGGSDLGAVVNPGGVEAVRSGGSAAADGVYGGTEYVSAGGQVAYNRVSDSYNGSAWVQGQQVILSGGSVSSNLVEYGGVQLVSSGGIDDGSIINGGTEYVEAGGVVSGVLIVQGEQDGTAYVEAGGIAYGGTIANGGKEFITSGGIATGDVVSGGTEYVSSGGFVGSANLDAGSLVISAGGQADILNVTSGVASIASGQSEILVQNDDAATVAAAGNAITTVTFNQSVSGGSLDFINNSTAAQTVFYGNQGSVTALGGAGGGFYAGGTAGNNVLTGGSGAVTLIGGGSGDVLQANSNTGLNALYAGNGPETLTASAASGENQFDLGPNSDGVISTAGSGLQGYFLNGTGGTTTITGSQSQGAFNLYEFLGDATAGGGAYVLTDFSPANSAIFLLNGTASGPSDATVSTVTGAAGGTFIGLSDGTQITLLGVAASSVQVITASNGVSVIV